MTQPVILVDVMDTLVYNPFNDEIPRFFGLSRQELLAQKHPTAWDQFETGQIDEDEYLRIYFADGRDIEREKFLNVVRNAYRWIEGAEDVLGELRRQGLDVHALSNYPIWYQNIEERLVLSRFLKWSFVSCQTGVRKPDTAAYLNAARTLNVTVDQCLFIDDNDDNCQAAESIGMPAIRFFEMATLRDELRQRGLVG